MSSPFDLDLNQLRVLDALLHEGTVTAASRRLGRPQSTVSTALAKLREALDDPLFTRSPQGIRPTPRAEALRDPLRRLLADLGAALAPPPPFDPATSERTFALAASDYTQFVLTAPLMEALAIDAPGARLRIEPAGHPPAWQSLAEGRLDLILAGRAKAPEGLRSRMLFRDTIVCILRSGHQALRQPWSLDRYLELSHIEVQSGFGRTLADQALQDLGHVRKVQAVVPHFLVAPFVTARTELCFTLARRIAIPLSKRLPLQVLPLPFPAPEVLIRAYWHPKAQEDAGHRWLRNRIFENLPESPRS